MRRFTFYCIIFIFSISISLSQSTFEIVFTDYLYMNYINDLIVTSDSNYLVLVSSEVIKIDQNGDELWRKTIPYSNTISETNDNGLVLSGGKITKLDENYDFEWESQDLMCEDVKQTSDGGYIVATYDFSICKTDSIGNILWTTPDFAISGFQSDAYSIIEASDGGYVMCGERRAWDNQFFVVKVDSGGTYEWSHEVGSTNYSDFGREIKNTSDNGLIAIGTTTLSCPGGYCILLIKYDLDGNEIFNKKFNYGEYTEGFSVSQAPDNGYILLGHTYNYEYNQSDINLVKTDSNGNQVWAKTFGVGNMSFAESVKATLDGGYIFLGAVNTDIQYYDSNPYLVKTDVNGSLGFDLLNNESNIINIFPNPTTGKVTVQAEGIVGVEVMNIQGEKVKSQKSNSKSQNCEVDLSQQAKGIYIIKVTTNKGVAVRKVVLE